MYDQEDAELYAHLAGPARFGLGNIRVSDEEIGAPPRGTSLISVSVLRLNLITADCVAAAGRSGVLWLSSFTNVVVSVVMTLFTLWIGKHMLSVSDTVDLESCSMADYTVELKPANDEEWSEFRVGGTKTRAKQKVALQQRVKKSLESAIPGSKLAEIGGEPAIWVAWDEETSITLWSEKRALLLQLEAALKARLSNRLDGMKLVEKVVAKLDSVNAKLQHVSPQQGDNVPPGHVPVAVFATFVDDASFEAALEMKQLSLHGVNADLKDVAVSIKGAPEPETLRWGNLQYSQRERRLRAATILACTVLVLALGVWAIIALSAVKETNSYTSGCKWVVGPNKNATASAICPGALDAADQLNDVYRNAYKKLSAKLASSEFPRIVGVDGGVSELPLGEICYPDRSSGVDGSPSVTWPAWSVSGSGETATANCHRIDEFGILFPNGAFLCYTYPVTFER